MHKQVTRTTSAVEAYNGILGRSAGKNGHFFKFVRIIQEEEFFKSRRFSILCESGGSLAKKKRKDSVEKNNKIREATLLLDEGKITVATFLSRMVYEKNEICVDVVPKLNIFEEESSEDEMPEELEEQPTRNNDTECIICQAKTPNIVLLPCKHLKICDDCILKLQADSISKGLQNYCCPYCRQIVEDTMQVYV